MTDEDMYRLLCQKAQNIRMKVPAADIAAIAARFNSLRRSTMKINEDDVWPILIFAMRYALGRRSTAPGIVTDIILANKDQLMLWQRKQMVEEVADQERTFGLGDQCDIDTWHRFATKIMEDEHETD